MPKVINESLIHSLSHTMSGYVKTTRIPSDITDITVIAFLVSENGLNTSKAATKVYMDKSSRKNLNKLDGDIEAKVKFIMPFNGYVNYLEIKIPSVKYINKIPVAYDLVCVDNTFIYDLNIHMHKQK